jgi:hypothetical protein
VIDYGLRIEMWSKKNYKEKSDSKKNGEKVVRNFDGAGT